MINNIIELRDKLNEFIEQGYGNVSVIGRKFEDDWAEGSIEWEYLEDIEICDRDHHGGAGLNLKFGY